MSKENLSFTQLEQQHNSQVPATVLVERSDHTITTGTYEGASQERPGRYDVSVDNGNGGRSLTADQLSDDYQAKLAEQLAGKPLRSELGGAAVQLAVGFIDRVPEEIISSSENRHAVDAEALAHDEEVTLNEQINSLLEGLGDDDKGRLFRYSMYTTDKSDAQKRGDGEASILYGQYLGQELNTMSADAQRVADRYHRLLNRLSVVRKQR